MGVGWGGQVDNARAGSALCGVAIGAIGRPHPLFVSAGLAWAACATIAAATDAGGGLAAWAFGGKDSPIRRWTLAGRTPFQPRCDLVSLSLPRESTTVSCQCSSASGSADAREDEMTTRSWIEI